MESGDKSNLTNHGQGYFSPTWSPDGQALAYFGANEEEETGSELYVQKVNGGTPRRLASDRIDYPSSPAWSSDSSKIAYVDGQSPYLPLSGSERAATQPTAPPTYRVYLINANGSGKKLLARSEGSGPQWSPDGSYLLFYSSYEGMMLVDANGNNPLLLTNQHDYGVSWAPDSRRLVFSRDDDLYLWSLAGGQ